MTTMRALQEAWDAKAPPEGEESLCSMQSLGEAQVLVGFELWGGEVVITGVEVNGYFVDPCEFSAATCAEWSRAIAKEYAPEEFA